jgi:hypothetical protein
MDPMELSEKQKQNTKNFFFFFIFSVAKESLVNKSSTEIPCDAQKYAFPYPFHTHTQPKIY